VETKSIGYPLPGHDVANPVHQRDVQRRWMERVAQHMAGQRITDGLRFHAVVLGDRRSASSVGLSCSGIRRLWEFISCTFVSPSSAGKTFNESERVSVILRHKDSHRVNF